MKALIAAWWDERQGREKRLILIALLVLALAIFYNVLIAPAWQHTADLKRSLPAMKQQLAVMQGQADEARGLSVSAQSVAPTGDSLLAAVTSSLSDRGFTGNKVQRAGSAVQVDLENVSFARWIGWVDDMRKQLKVQVVQTHITPTATNDGRVSLRVTLDAAQSNRTSR